MDPYHSQRGMVAPLVLAVLLIGAALLGARYANQPSESPSPTPEPSASPMLPETGEASPLASPDPDTLVTEFSMAGYMNAVKTGKLVVLYFTANWCLICSSEFPKFQAAIAALAYPRVAAFQVNYNDSDTDSEEKTAAKTFQVGSEGTLVIVDDGKAVYKSNSLVDYEFTIAEHLK